jgi:hypothetical protein
MPRGALQQSGGASLANFELPRASRGEEVGVSEIPAEGFAEDRYSLLPGEIFCDVPLFVVIDEGKMRGTAEFNGTDVDLFQ